VTSSEANLAIFLKNSVSTKCSVSQQLQTAGIFYESYEMLFSEMHVGIIIVIIIISSFNI